MAVTKTSSVLFSLFMGVSAVDTALADSSKNAAEGLVSSFASSVDYKPNLTVRDIPAVRGGGYHVSGMINSIDVGSFKEKCKAAGGIDVPDVPAVGEKTVVVCPIPPNLI